MLRRSTTASSWGRTSAKYPRQASSSYKARIILAFPTRMANRLNRKASRLDLRPERKTWSHLGGPSSRAAGNDRVIMLCFVSKCLSASARDLQLGIRLKALTVHCLDEHVITTQLPLTGTYERFPQFRKERKNISLVE